MFGIVDKTVSSVADVEEMKPVDKWLLRAVAYLCWQGLVVQRQTGTGVFSTHSGTCMISAPVQIEGYISSRVWNKRL